MSNTYKRNKDKTHSLNDEIRKNTELMKIGDSTISVLTRSSFCALSVDTSSCIIIISCLSLKVKTTNVSARNPGVEAYIKQ